MVLCGNKKDHPGVHINPKAIQFHRKRNLLYVETSAKYAYNVDRLILSLVRAAVPRQEIPEEGVGFASPPSLTQTFDADETPTWQIPTDEGDEDEND